MLNKFDSPRQKVDYPTEDLNNNRPCPEVLASQSGKGNTAIEYSLVGVSVLVVSVGLWMLVGANLKNQFLLLKTDMQMRGVGTLVQNIRQAVDNVNSVKTDDGRTINTTAPLSTGQAPTQTAGTSGNTAEISKALQNLSAKAVREDKMTDEQAANLDALSKQVLKMAEIQKAIEAAMVLVGDHTEALLTMQVQFEKKSYTVAELADMIGWKENKSGEGNPLRPDANANGPELNKLKELYQQAEENGALKDPAVQDLVSKLTDKVAKLSNISKEAQKEVTPVIPAAANSQYQESVASGCEKNQGVCKPNTTTTSGSTKQAGQAIGNQ